MNFRNKYLVLTLRILFGLFFIFSGVSGWYAGLHNMQGVPADMIESTQVIWDNGIFQFIKTTEIIAGLMLVLGIFPALAVIFLAPICIGVIIVNSLTAPDYVITGVIVSIINAYFGYVYWDKYKALFTK